MRRLEPDLRRDRLRLTFGLPFGGQSELSLLTDLQLNARLVGVKAAMTPEQYRRAKAVFQEAVELPSQERAGFVERECGDDPDVSREVLSLLQHHEPAPPDTAAPDPAAYAVSRSRAEASHTFLGRSGRRLRILAVLAGFVGVGILAWWTDSALQRSLQQLVESQLEDMADLSAAAFDGWVKTQIARVDALAEDPELARLTAALVAAAAPGTDLVARLGPATEAQRILDLLRPTAEHLGYTNYGVLGKDYVILASTTPALRGRQIRTRSRLMLDFDMAFRGRTVLSPPRRYGEQTERLVGHVPPRKIISFLAPIRDAGGQVLAVLSASLDADKEYPAMGLLGRRGTTSETYLFDETGMLMSPSRFEPDLRRAGLLAADESSPLTVQLRDPGRPIAGFDAGHADASGWPLTALVGAATAGRAEGRARSDAGVFAAPYRDYRGESVVGAWRWLPEQGLGVASEIDADELLAPARFIRLPFGVLFAILTLAAGSSIWSSFTLARLNRDVASRRRIGPYQLLRKLGEGGLGEVHLARHDLLRRTTALKLLKSVDAAAVARFEREVQLTSELRHPNTVTIYDYGRSSDGTFYYVMEYLPGVNLETLIRVDGRLPPARTAYLLAQACRSLHEAHQRGLVHRDIKPANIMICCLGAECDVVKVVDFGLVKAMSAETRGETTQLHGTPHYVAPERLKRPASTDPRLDVYALGATGYKMLAGRSIFASVVDVNVLYDVINTDPEPLSELCPDCPPALSSVIMACLHKDPAQRPQSVKALLDALEPLAAAWTLDAAASWWRKHSDLVSPGDSIH
jgi:hypothetical protein